MSYRSKVIWEPVAKYSILPTASTMQNTFNADINAFPLTVINIYFSFAVLLYYSRAKGKHSVFPNRKGNKKAPQSKIEVLSFVLII